MKRPVFRESLDFRHDTDFRRIFLGYFPRDFFFDRDKTRLNRAQILVRNRERLYKIRLFHGLHGIVKRNGFFRGEIIRCKEIVFHFS